ncbi:hypothetical protein, partial [Escherichia coli]|uniref:hypothetical protein n=1 Tax=Escherichia coli TaxID=562 RepID=UPI002B2552DA
FITYGDPRDLHLSPRRERQMCRKDRGEVGRKILAAGHNLLTAPKKYSFLAGFEKRLLSSFKREDIIKINKVW